MSETNKLYIGNLDYSVTSDELQAFLSENYEISDCKVIDGKGFAFVTFADQSAAAAAKDALNDHEFRGRKFKIDFARERQPRRSFR